MIHTPAAAGGAYMSEVPQTTKKRASWAWVLWWQIDPSELDDQVTKYDSLSFIKSARGQAVLCLLLSVVITAVILAISKKPDLSGLVDVGLFLILAVFIYSGHRWAMIAAMALWTLEKGLYIVVGVTAAQSGSTSGGGLLFTQVIWWCIYMHAFYFAFRVEQERRKRAVIATI
jgi:TRAP-type C4-dicarboxylate transport system permease large subunit